MIYDPSYLIPETETLNTTPHEQCIKVDKGWDVLDHLS
jgi:hypothetical protein